MPHPTLQLVLFWSTVSTQLILNSTQWYCDLRLGSFSSSDGDWVSSLFSTSLPFNLGSILSSKAQDMTQNNSFNIETCTFYTNPWKLCFLLDYRTNKTKQNSRKAFLSLQELNSHQFCRSKCLISFTIGVDGDSTYHLLQLNMRSACWEVTMSERPWGNHKTYSEESTIFLETGRRRFSNPTLFLKQ